MKIYVLWIRRIWLQSRRRYETKKFLIDFRKPKRELSPRNSLHNTVDLFRAYCKSHVIMLYTPLRIDLSIHTIYCGREQELPQTWGSRPTVSLRRHIMSPCKSRVILHLCSSVHEKVKTFLDTHKERFYSRNEYF